MEPHVSPKKNISTQSFKDMSQRNDSAYLPVLLDIQSPYIVWEGNDNEQENGHLRLINDVRGVKYKGNELEPKYFAPANFKYKKPKEDGKKKGKASLSCTCTDERMIEVIRSINEDLDCNIVALYAHIDDNKFAFAKMDIRSFKLTSVQCDKLTATWELNSDEVTDLSVPRDKGSNFRCPAIMGSK